MKKERKVTVRTVSNATVDDNTVAGSTVAMLTVHSSNDATVFESRVRKNI